MLSLNMLQFYETFEFVLLSRCLKTWFKEISCNFKTRSNVKYHTNLVFGHNVLNTSLMLMIVELF